MRGDKVVGRGVTGVGGRPHGETVALADAGALARGATAYVSFEPCAHFGQTPPCANALVAAGVKRVVIGCVDPDPRVSGQRNRNPQAREDRRHDRSARRRSATAKRRIHHAD